MKLARAARSLARILEVKMPYVAIFFGIGMSSMKLQAQTLMKTLEGSVV